MALRALSQLTNIEKSLNVYLEGTLVTTAGYTVIFPRETVPSDTLPSQWIEVHYIPLAEEFSIRQVHLGIGTNRLLLVNVNCYEQRQDQLGQSGGGAGQYTLSAMIDTVTAVLGPKAAIPIRDYATSGNPQVGGFGWRSLRAGPVRGLEREGIEQWNVSATLTYPDEHVV